MVSQDKAFNALKSELKKGFAGLTKKVRFTNERLDENNKELKAFKKDVSTKLDGLGSYPRSINGNILDHSKRIFKLENRVDNIEKRFDA